MNFKFKPSRRLLLNVVQFVIIMSLVTSVTFAEQDQYNNLRDNYNTLVDRYNHLLHQYNNLSTEFYNGSAYQTGFQDGYTQGLKNATIKNIITNNITKFTYSYYNNSFKSLVNVQNFTLDRTSHFVNLTTFKLNNTAFDVLGSFQYYFSFNTTIHQSTCNSDNSICTTTSKVVNINDSYIEVFGQLHNSSLQYSQSSVFNSSVWNTFILSNGTVQCPLAVFLPFDIISWAYFLSIAFGNTTHPAGGQYGFIDPSYFKLMFYESSLTKI